MKTWWQGLNGRERLLVSLAALISGVVLLWQGVVAPTARAQESAKRELETASLQLDRLLEGYAQKRMAGQLTAVPERAQTGLSAEAFKGAVTRDAAAKGLSIARLQGDGQASISLVFERVQPQQLFYWLQSVETEFGGRVSRMTLEQTGDGAVRASVELEQAGS